MRLYLDLETRSRLELRTSNPYRYVEDKEFRILKACYALNDDTVTSASYEEADWEVHMAAIWVYISDPGIIKVAHNATFERMALSAFYGVGIIQPDDWDDTMPRAGEHGYPQSLEMLSRALGGEQKSTAGTRLINLFSKPKRNGSFVQPEDRPVQWKEFGDYCAQDVETLRSVDRALPDWPEGEREVWLADQRINDHGFRVDLDLCAKAVEAAEANRMEQELEVMHLTGIANPSSVQQLGGWLKENAVAPPPSLTAEAVEHALAKEPPGVARRVLELRQELAMTAYKKFTAALQNATRDGRVHGAFKFFGAHTGRWSGRGLQPQNLPREQLPTEEDTDLAILDLMLDAGADAKTLKALVRAAIVGPFTVVDYNAIEARVIAWLAGEQWTLDAFADGRDVYVETAARMGGLTRSQGKIAVLALGFGGGVHSLQVMMGDAEYRERETGKLVAAGSVGAAQHDASSLRRAGSVQTSEDRLQEMVYAWRNANPAIVDFWRKLEHAFKSGGRAGRISVERDGANRMLVLPSGRAITYHKCALRPSVKNADRRVLSFASPTGVGRIETYGGRLAENVTQAVARDILAAALVRLLDRGYWPVAHVHDETIVEGEHKISTIANIMCEPPAWATMLPLAAEGFHAQRYRKG